MTAQMIVTLRGRRGFTLVELAVALAVVGLLLGLSLIPLRALEERRQIREEMHRLEAARDAIVGYALRHRTRERTILFVAYDTPVIPNSLFNRVSLVLLGPPMAFRLPGGRPYLPCPDWDGDGYEDRIPAGTDGFTQGTEIKPDLTVTATLLMGDGLDFPAGPHWDFPYGSCLQSRGSVPWRTLGVEPSDGWGNRHTYFADPVFANALLGFDELSIADIYDSRAPRAAGLGPSPRRDVFVSTRNFNLGSLISYELGNDCPSVICDGGRAGGCVRECNVGRADMCLPEPPIDHPAWRCLWRAAPDDLVLKAGAITKREIFSESPRGKRFPPGGVTDGLPFVLASHGPNGRFAVNHWATLLNPVNEFGSASPICNNYAWATHRSNFDSDAVVDPGDRALIHEAANGSRLSPDPARCAQVKELMDIYHPRDEFNRSFFVWEPPGTSDKSDFDDLLLWMTREELSLAISGDIPRLPQMIVPYFP